MAKKPKDTDGAIEAVLAADEATKALRAARWPEDPRLKPIPPRYESGRPSIEHFRHKYACVNALSHAISMGWEEMPRGFNLSQARDLVDSEVRASGYDPKRLADTRSPEDKMLDVRDSLLESPESIREVSDLELDVLEQEFEHAVAGCQKVIDSHRPEVTHDDILERERKRHAKGKAWVSRIRRVKRLREWMQTTRVPKGEDPVRRASAFQAAKPLFFMLYVTHSSMDVNLRDGKYAKIKIHLIGEPHCQMAVTIWEARNGVQYTKDGIKKGEAYDGALVELPPGHGKTSLVMAIAGLEASVNELMQGIYVHFKEDIAEENLAFISRMFDLDNPMGRRRNAVYPGRHKTPYDNNAGSLRLACKNEPKSPTLVAVGVNSSSLSTDSNIQFWDDIIPKTDRDQPTERERRMATMSSSWKSRIRGKGFILFTGYPFHKADVLSKHAEMIRTVKISWIMLRLPVGSASTTPMFKSIWPEVYPPSRLRAIFEETNRDHSLWAANYELNPISDSGRLIRKLRLYDPGDPQHENFMATAMCDVSVDPTATNREKSDHAGVLYMAIGMVSTSREGEWFDQRRIRLLDAVRLHANQIELADHIAQFALQYDVNRVFVEVRSSSGSATCDLLEQRDKLVVERLDPTNIKKGIRLKACSGIIDHSEAHPALVEFPGVWDDDKLVLDPRFETVAKQLIDFGVEEADEFVDALSQYVNRMLAEGELVAGNGEATRQIRLSMKLVGDPRMIAALAEDEKTEPKSEVEEEDEWMRSMSARW